MKLPLTQAGRPAEQLATAGLLGQSPPRRPAPSAAMLLSGTQSTSNGSRSLLAKNVDVWYSVTHWSRCLLPACKGFALTARWKIMACPKGFSFGAAGQLPPYFSRALDISFLLGTAFLDGRKRSFQHRRSGSGLCILLFLGKSCFVTCIYEAAAPHAHATVPVNHIASSILSLVVR